MAEQLALIETARAERERLLARLAENHSEYLGFVRAVARDVARRDGTVDIDRVHAEMRERDLPMPAEIGADNRILGPLFRTADFVATGKRLTSRAERIARAGECSSYVVTYTLREFVVA